jgi:hypothetical protein
MADDTKGRELLSAVERLVASDAALKEVVAACEAKVGVRSGGAKRDLEAIATEVIKHFTTRAMVVGGAAGLPALIPGWGTVVAAVGGGLAELAMVLKYEVEMSLCLTHLYGFDIAKREERQLAFLLASVGTYDAGGKNFFADVVKAEGVALWNYGPRKVAKMLVTAMAQVALLYVWRGFFRVVPLLGMAIGGSLNKVLTQRVGQRCARDLKTRRDLLKQASAPSAKSKVKPKRRRAEKTTPRAQ